MLRRPRASASPRSSATRRRERSGTASTRDAGPGSSAATRDGKPVGKVRLTAVGDKMSTLKVIEGEVAAGDKVDVRPPAHDHPSGKQPAETDLTREELGRIEREVASTPKGVDYVAVGFL